MCQKVEITSLQIQIFRNKQGRMAYWIRHQTSDLEIAGSSPATDGQYFSKHKPFFVFLAYFLAFLAFGVLNLFLNVRKLHSTY